VVVWVPLRLGWRYGTRSASSGTRLMRRSSHLGREVRVRGRICVLPLVRTVRRSIGMSVAILCMFVLTLTVTMALVMGVG
jgi:hypothetical protein